MKNIALIICYKGTNFHGWQVQGNIPTIQKSITDAIYKLTQENVYVSGCGRTDSGVHAKVYVANFKANIKMPIHKLALALNAHLSHDISIKKAIEVPDDFDARFSCIKKEYTYNIYVSNTRNPLLSDYSYFCVQQLNIDDMKKASKYFVGTLDFASVKSTGTPVSSTVRTMHYANVYEDKEFIKISLCADGFLYNMVRAIAGTLVAVGSGKIKPEYVCDILNAKDRSMAAATLPPQGLFMTKLFYDDTNIGEIT